MALPPHAVDWMRRANVDYIGPFVKAWAAFNAWYRHASQANSERAMLDFVKHQPNAVRRSILPLLDTDNHLAEAQSLKQDVCDLHLALDRIQFEVLRKGNRERISFRSVCLTGNRNPQSRHERNGFEFRAEKTNVGFEAVITRIRDRDERFRETQPEYDPDDIYGRASFRALSHAQQTEVRRVYTDCNPRPMSDLVRGDGPSVSPGDGPLVTGSVEFCCSGEVMFHALIELIYAMRNALLHGEAEPDGNVLSCYEPGYRIIMQFLSALDV